MIRSKAIAVSTLFVAFVLLTSGLGMANEAPVTLGDLELVARLGGPITDVALQRNLAYVTVGFDLFILDISEPAMPLKIGETTVLSDKGLAAVVVEGEYAYVASGTGLHVVDVSNPTAPTQVGMLDLPGAILVAKHDEYTYIATGTNLYAVDVTNVTAPSISGLIGIDDIKAIDVDDAYVFAVDDYALWLIDTSDPANLTKVGAFEGFQSSEAVAAVDKRAYVGDQVGLHILDVSIPSKPIEVGLHPSPSNVGERSELMILGDVAYLIRNWQTPVFTGGCSLEIINVSDPENPFEIGAFRASCLVSKLAISRAHAYLVESRGLRIIDVSDPTSPFQVSVFESPEPASHSVVCAYDFCYGIDWSDSFYVMDVSDPYKPRLTGSINIGGIGFDLDVRSGYVYVAAQEDGVRIIDVANPELPTEVGYVMTAGIAHSVAVAGDYLFVAANESGLQIFALDDPTAPTETGSYALPVDAWHVTVAAPYAYVTGFGSDMWIVDISDPMNPTEAGYYGLSAGPRDMFVAENYAYVAADGLRILDISDLASITEVGSLDMPFGSSGVEVLGGYAFVTTPGGAPLTPPTVYSGLWLVDVTDPTTPVQMDEYITPGYSFGVAANGNFAYVADLDGGLIVMRGHILEHQLFIPFMERSDTQ